MKNKFILAFVFAFLAVGALFSFTGCSEDVNKDEFAQAKWHQMEVSQEELTLSDDFANQSELYLFISRDLIESDYEVSKATLGNENIELIDSSFNLTSPDFEALFLVGKFKLEDTENSKVLKVPSPITENEIVIAYKEESEK